MSEENFFSTNLVSLMSAYGDSRTVLANKLGVSEATISYWVKGRNLPRRKILDTLASRYFCTYEELLYSDLSHMSKRNVSTALADFQLTSISIFPFVDPDEPVSSIHFKKAIESHRRYIRSMSCNAPIEENEIFRIYEEYSLAVSDDKCVEAACNLLFFVLIYYYSLMNPDIIELVDKAISIPQRLKNMMRSIFSGDVPLFTKEGLKKRTAFISECDTEIKSLLQMVKRSPNYYDISDFYLAMFYTVGFVNNENSLLINAQTGNTLMNAFASMGNPYAEKYVSAFTPHWT